MWLWFLAACHGPSQTGEQGMVGRLVGADGAPIGGVVVQSVEAEVRTDADGRFAVAWKPPGTHAFFDHGGMSWLRALQPDDPAEVELRLPELRDATVVCPKTACRLELEWPVSAGFKGKRSLACEPGLEATAPLPAVAAVGSCKVAGKALDLEVLTDGDRIRVLPPVTPLRVEIHAVEGSLPDDCQVLVGGAIGKHLGDGVFAADRRGPTVASAVCGARPAWSVAVDGSAGSVTVDWSPGGPHLDLEGSVPDVAGIVLHPEQGPPLRVGVSSLGTLALPPLSAGTYRIRVEAGDPVPEAPPAVEPTGAGTLELSRAEDGNVVGVLRLEADLSDGRVPVSGP